jgi:hypothetical protein
MSGLDWKANRDEVLDRRRRFYRRELQDGILATLQVATDARQDWEAFQNRWGAWQEGQLRPFPSNEEVFDRETIGLQQRGRVEDDWLPVSYSILDAGESMVGAMFGAEMKFMHRPCGPAVSFCEHLLPDYSQLGSLAFSLESPWTRRFLSIQDYFAEHCNGSFSQHPCLVMDGLNFACEMRGATQMYVDLYEYPQELRALLELGLDFNIRFQEAQMRRTGAYRDGSFVWMGGWVPFPRAISISVDAYVVCSPQTYAEFGYDYQRRLLEHFGHGLLHFHCNRVDLAREVAKLPHLELFQFGGDPHDPKPDHEYLPEMRKAVGDLPMMVAYPYDLFVARLAESGLPPNVHYHVVGKALAIDEANRLADRVRKYRPRPGVA